MKSLLSLLLCISLFSTIQAQIVDIPDPNFKARLLQASSSLGIAFDADDNPVTIDTNNNSEIEVQEALQIFRLSIINQDVSDLTGIEAFTSLNHLSCWGNDLQIIDISSNSNLQFLSLRNNQLTSIDVSQNPNLINLYLSDNYLTSIDLSQNIDLEYLSISENELSSLDISQNLDLEFLNCDKNNITVLDVSQHVSLKQLSFGNNEISNVDVAQCLNLEVFECHSNNLTTLDVTQNLNLENLRCNSNNLSNLDVTQNPNLVSLSCSYNNLSNLDVTQNPNLVSLSCSYNNLSTLNVEQNLNLESLDCRYNNLALLDVSQNDNLEYLVCSDNQLTNIEVAQDQNIDFLSFSDNQMSYFDFSLLPNLTKFFCSDNLLTELDLSNNNELESWSCENNQITNINIKNGGVSFDESTIFFLLDISNNPIEFICADEEEILVFQEFTNFQGPISTHCTFAPGGDYNTISGIVKLDLDNNGCANSDHDLTNVRIRVDDGTPLGYTFSNQLGEYTFYTETGNYQLTPELESPDFFNVSPLNTVVDFTDLNNSVSQDFCITPNGIHNDLEIVIVPIVPARPGFDADYQIVYKNKGNQSLSGNINFNYDAAVLDLISTSETPTLQSSGSLSWDYVDLIPFETRVIDLVLNVNSPMETPAVNIGDMLDFTATINPVANDETANDNTFILQEVVIGSYDPNDITCLEGDVVSPDKIGEYLHYNIRFENTGTAPAIFVVVRNDIDEAQYDLSSLQILNASHDMYARINGNRVEFIFDDINLAPNVIGNILFKIKTLYTLTVGDDVAQQAEIYFDYNFPIITNIAQTNFQVLSTNDLSFDSSIKIYPNPANDFITIDASLPIERIKVYDIQGRLIETNVFDSTDVEVDVSNYVNGVYFLEINSSVGSTVERIIKN